MATVTIDATYQGISSKFEFGITDWLTDIRDAVNGNNTVTYTTTTQDNNAIRVSNISGRLGSSGDCYRTFLFFEGIGTAVGGGTVTDAQLRVWNGGSYQTTQAIVAAANAWGGDGSDGNLNDGDYSSVDYGQSYSLETGDWKDNSYNNFDLLLDAINFINNNGYLNCAVVEFNYDYSGVNPPFNSIITAPVGFLDSTNKIKLEITYTPAGYSKKVIGVDPSSIGRVNGVLSANISKVIGVS